MSESSKVKKWADANSVTLEAKQTGKTFMIQLLAPKGKCFTANDAHILLTSGPKAEEVWKLVLTGVRQGLDECPVVCECRNGMEPVRLTPTVTTTLERNDEAVPPLQTENATITPPPPQFARDLALGTIIDNGSWNRERWLTELAGKLRPVLESAGAVLPALFKLSCGWPSKNATASKNRTIGQCFAPVASAGGVTEMFISPALSDPLEVAAVAVHELIHATGAFKHTGSFKRIALAAGLEGRMTSTHAGEALKARLNAVLATLPPYPHSSLSALAGNQKKDGTRLLKVVCPDAECGYTIRTTQKWIDVGFPTCPCDEVMGLAE